MDLKNKKNLLTGSTGLIGGEIYHRLPNKKIDELANIPKLFDYLGHVLKQMDQKSVHDEMMNP